MSDVHKKEEIFGIDAWWIRALLASLFCSICAIRINFFVFYLHIWSEYQVFGSQLHHRPILYEYDGWCYFTCLSQNRVGPKAGRWIISSHCLNDDYDRCEQKKTSRRHIVSCDSGISERFATCKKPNMHSVTSKPNICSRLASTNKELFRMISKLRL